MAIEQGLYAAPQGLSDLDTTGIEIEIENLYKEAKKELPLTVPVKQNKLLFILYKLGGKK
jgi:hypothetical protein